MKLKITSKIHVVIKLKNVLVLNMCNAHFKKQDTCKHLSYFITCIIIEYDLLPIEKSK